VHLHGKDGGAVADMAVGDVRLDRNHGHAAGRSDIRCLCGAAATTRGEPFLNTRKRYAAQVSRAVKPKCADRSQDGQSRARHGRSLRGNILKYMYQLRVKPGLRNATEMLLRRSKGGID
jgi:hypothetical protein